MNTRAIIDYAIQDDAAAMRDALYAEIQDRVHSHIEMKKQEIAQGLVTTQEEDLETSDEQEEGTSEE
jgi:hypothetical protein